ncbi:DUF3618 domain-containing protein [Nocardia vinacea]|uniref:DUF3618 domain-containing protein n=1 Tax=Nocardia vinacea TaxID=96468 RepID=UPI0002E96F1F|nr:DUF3618 domain-containing protein [Nocardia vinacea]
MSDEIKPSVGSLEAELLRADRDLARQELGQTMAELTGKLDVKGRVEAELHHTVDNARAKVHHAAEAVREKREKAGAATQDRAVQFAAVTRSRPVPVAAAVTVAVAALVTWLILRDRRNLGEKRLSRRRRHRR